MDATRIFWFTLKLLVVTIGICGAFREKTVEDYVDNVIGLSYANINDKIPDNKSVVLKNVEIFLNDSLDPHFFSEISLGKFSGLGTTFRRAGSCYVKEKRIDFRISCKVEFQGLHVQLPTVKNDGTIITLFINATGNLYLSWPKDDNPVKVNIITLSNVTFKMKAYNTYGVESSTMPPTYSLDNDSPTQFKDTYKLLFQHLITQGAFKDALELTFENVPEHPSLRKAEAHL
uniref:Putative secreted protein n=1 Tax=Ixodes ricinus TaxID=34613 RepID=A0A6B0V4Q3_IXORI